MPFIRSPARHRNLALRAESTERYPKENLNDSQEFEQCLPNPYWTICATIP
jgi:hypothetical protein